MEKTKKITFASLVALSVFSFLSLLFLIILGTFGFLYVFSMPFLLMVSILSLVLAVMLKKNSEQEFYANKSICVANIVLVCLAVLIIVITTIIDLIEIFESWNCYLSIITINTILCVILAVPQILYLLKLKKANTLSKEELQKLKFSKHKTIIFVSLVVSVALAFFAGYMLIYGVCENLLHWGFEKNPHSDSTITPKNYALSLEILSAVVYPVSFLTSFVVSVCLLAKMSKATDGKLLASKKSFVSNLIAHIAMLVDVLLSTLGVAVIYDLGVEGGDPPLIIVLSLVALVLAVVSLIALRKIRLSGNFTKDEALKLVISKGGVIGKQLAEIEELKKHGVISDEEYNRLRNRILGKE